MNPSPSAWLGAQIGASGGKIKPAGKMFAGRDIAIAVCRKNASLRN
jgi:hypothetical protein